MKQSLVWIHKWIFFLHHYLNRNVYSDQRVYSNPHTWYCGFMYLVSSVQNGLHVHRGDFVTFFNLQTSFLYHKEGFYFHFILNILKWTQICYPFQTVFCLYSSLFVDRERSITSNYNSTRFARTTWRQLRKWCIMGRHHLCKCKCHLSPGCYWKEILTRQDNLTSLSAISARMKKKDKWFLENFLKMNKIYDIDLRRYL